MTSLLDIRRRIQSVQNVEQITKTMEMVAAAQLKKAQSRAQAAEAYAKHWDRIRAQYTPSILIEEPLLFEKKTESKTAVMVISSDRGLCGNFNHLVLKKTEELLKELDPQNVELILVGKQSLTAFNRSRWQVIERIVPWGGKITFKEIQSLSERLLQFYRENRYDRLLIVHSEAKTALHRTVVIDDLLPLKKTEESIPHPPYLLEQEIGVVTEAIVQNYLFSRLNSILEGSYAAELAARTFAMKKATKNAQEMLVSLTLKRNKLRQAGITREMIEITAGAERSLM